MESHHAAAAFSLLRSPGCFFLEGLKGSDFRKLRKTVVDLVMATDMKQHFSIVSQFISVHGLVTTDDIVNGGWSNSEYSRCELP